MSSSSDDDDQERNMMLMSAVDPQLFKDSMFKMQKNKEKVTEEKKSQKHLALEEQRVDVRISSDMQTRIGKKLSEVISSQIKFVNLKAEPKSTPLIEGGVKLFKDSTTFVTDTEPEEFILKKEHRKKVKRRKLAEEEDCEDVESCVVSGDFISSQKDTEQWKSRRKEKVFKYKMSKNNKTAISIDN